MGGYMNTELELQQCREALVKTKDEVQQLVYILSHDMREPLRLVMSFTQLLEDRCRDNFDEDASEFVFYVNDSVTRMENMLDGLLAFSRVETQAPIPMLTDCNEVLAQSLKQYSEKLQQCQAEVHADDLPSVNIAPAYLKTLFGSLLDNALKYRHPVRQLQISITVKQELQSWRFSIKDNGVGFKNQLADRAFRVFQRLHVDDDLSGVGMGLPICKRIVERYGGDMGVISEVGQGSDFWFSLPMATS